jgi:hypothetical protein
VEREAGSRRLARYLDQKLEDCVHRSALATDPPQRQDELYITEPVYQLEEEEPQYTKVVVVSAMQDIPCLAEGGDKLHYLSVLNKQVSRSSCPCCQSGRNLGCLSLASVCGWYIRDLQAV